MTSTWWIERESPGEQHRRDELSLDHMDDEIEGRRQESLPRVIDLEQTRK